MARVLVFCEGVSFAHIARATLSAHWLHNSGHDVRLLGPPQAQAACKEYDVPFILHQGCCPNYFFNQLAKGRAAWTTAEIISHYHADLQALKTHRPDFIISEFRPTAVWAAQTRSIPTWVIIEAPSHPHFTPPAVAPQSFCQPAILPNWLFDSLAASPFGTSLAKFGWQAALRPWQQAAPFCNQTLPRHWSDVFASGDRVFIADHPLLWPHLSLRAQDCWLGAPQWNGQGQCPPKPTSSGNNIYMTMGTQCSLDAHKTLRLAEHLGNAGYNVILSQGGRHFPVASHHPRVHLYPFVNEALLLPQVDLVVHPGGAMTTWRAIHHGCPQFHLPTHAHQQFYAVALTAADLGGWARPKRHRTAHLAQQILDQMKQPHGVSTCQRAATLCRSINPEAVMNQCGASPAISA